MNERLELKPARTIPPQEWMTSPAAHRLLAALEKGQGASREPAALFVGGCVRNALFGREVDDIDLATPLTPEKVMDLCKAQEITVIPTGLKHGTVTAVIDGTHFEITTLRRDVETDGRRAEVSFTQNWIEDAQRRDFTMNTLLADPNGNVYDPTGQGIEDLDAGRIRFVGDPVKRIQEDYLRILRFFRFHAIYGGEEFELDALRACRAASDKIATLSRERITQEFFKIMASDKPRRILDIMFENNILKDFSFLEYEPDALDHLCYAQKRYGLVSLPSRLYVQAGMNLENIKAMENLILFPKVFLKDMQAIKGALSQPDLSCASAVRAGIYRFGRTITAQALMIELTQDRVVNAFAPTALQIIQTWEIPEFPVTGEDLLEAGIKAGPLLGQTLEELEEEWIASDFNMTPDELYKSLKKKL
ncbi:MAG: CCA tRNA nucleotidyltransferase [Alphaproteobacteria bacterium]|nr:CCA tRNA nucleotidyltransferase [Alphaproteobacteria bacterium]MCB9974057.1 CCA tRNA nucleotidyltransferase [Rhodospirillales bacterium]